MVLWFLHLFPAFAALERKLRAAENRADLLQRDADHATQMLSEQTLRADNADAHIEDLKRMVDHLSWQLTRRYVFARNEVPVVAQDSQPRPVTGRRFARDEVQRRAREFQQEIEQLTKEAAETVEKAG